MRPPTADLPPLRPGQPGRVSAESLAAWFSGDRVVERVLHDLTQTMSRHPRERLLERLLLAGQDFTETSDVPDPSNTASATDLERLGMFPTDYSSAARLAVQRLLMSPPPPPLRNKRSRKSSAGGGKAGAARQRGTAPSDVTAQALMEVIAKTAAFQSACTAQMVLGLSTDDAKGKIPVGSTAWIGTLTALVLPARVDPITEQGDRSAGHLVRCIYLPGSFDLIGYLWESQRRTPEEEPDTTAFIDDISRALSNPALWGTDAIDPTLKRLCEAMRTDAGFDLRDMVMLADALYRDDARLYRVPLSYPHDHLAALDQQHASSMVAAFTYMTCDRQGLLANKHRDQPLRHREHAVRLNTHPIVATRSGYLIAPRLVIRTVTHYLSLTRLGDWPVQQSLWSRQWPTFFGVLAQSRPGSIKNERGAAFERVVADHLVQVGLPMLHGVNANARIGNVVMPGEVDHLVVDYPSRQIWVIEDKDIIEPRTPMAARDCVRSFVAADDGYAVKNQKNVAAIAVDPAGVASHVLERCRRTHPSLVASQEETSPPPQGSLGDTPGHGSLQRPWTVRGVLVIRDLGPMGWVTGLDSTVVDASSVVDLIRTDLITAQHEPT